MDNHNLNMTQEEMNKEYKLSCEINAKFRAAQQKFWAEVQSSVPADPVKLFQVTPEEEEALYKDAVARLEAATNNSEPAFVPVEEDSSGDLYMVELEKLAKEHPEEFATDEDVPHYEVFNGKGPKCDVKAAQE